MNATTNILQNLEFQPDQPAQRPFAMTSRLSVFSRFVIHLPSADSLPRSVVHAVVTAKWTTGRWAGSQHDFRTK